MTEKRSPRISSLTWGRLETEDGHIYSDAILYPGGGTNWDWTLTGTRHVPGIQPEILEPIIKNGAKIVVLTLGHYKRLQICQKAFKYLEDKDVTIHVVRTDEAVKLYNELAQTELVGGVFHTTC